MLSFSQMTAGMIFVNNLVDETVVCRYRRGGPFDVTWERAMNWQSLERQARHAILTADGNVPVAGHYVCPAVLQSRAQFDKSR